jgi:hypothetical protein
MQTSFSTSPKHWRRLAHQCISLLQRAGDQETRILILSATLAYAQTGDSLQGKGPVPVAPSHFPSLPIEFIQGLRLNAAY